MDEAKRMIQFSLPIKCLEAVVLAMYLTSGLKSVTRFTLIFHSTVGSHVYKHIVLAVYHEGRFGALGLSRRPDLMDKSLSHVRLMDLVQDYKDAYARNGHVLQRCFVGLPIPHDTNLNEPLTWRSRCIDFSRCDAAETLNAYEVTCLTQK
jgi:hypothetical protein